MFCPNCGVKGSTEQNFCRGCGLKLDAVIAAVSEQDPSGEYAELQRGEERKKRIGVACLAIAAIIGFSMLLFRAAQWKLELLGEGVLFWSAGIALIAFLLLAVLFFTYPSALKAKLRRLREGEETPAVQAATTRLIEERPFEPASSVTEETTEVFELPRSKRNEDRSR